MATPRRPQRLLTDTHERVGRSVWPTSDQITTRADTARVGVVTVSYNTIELAGASAVLHPPRAARRIGGRAGGGRQRVHRWIGGAAGRARTGRPAPLGAQSPIALSRPGSTAASRSSPNISGVGRIRSTWCGWSTPTSWCSHPMQAARMCTLLSAERAAIVGQLQPFLNSTAEVVPLRSSTVAVDGPGAGVAPPDPGVPRGRRSGSDDAARAPPTAATAWSTSPSSPMPRCCTSARARCAASSRASAATTATSTGHMHIASTTSTAAPTAPRSTPRFLADYARSVPTLNAAALIAACRTVRTTRLAAVTPDEVGLRPVPARLRPRRGGMHVLVVTESRTPNRTVARSELRPRQGRECTFLS